MRRIVALTPFDPLAGDSAFVDLLGAGFHLWFGGFVGMQTMKTRAVFDEDSFELKTVTNKVLGLQASVRPTKDSRVDRVSLSTLDLTFVRLGTQRDKGLRPKEYKNYVLGTSNKWSGAVCPCAASTMSGEHLHVSYLRCSLPAASPRRYDSFVNWDFFPCIQLPLLVYFKETQTPEVGVGALLAFSRA